MLTNFNIPEFILNSGAASAGSQKRSSASGLNSDFNGILNRAMDSSRAADKQHRDLRQVEKNSGGAAEKLAQDNGGLRSYREAVSAADTRKSAVSKKDESITDTSVSEKTGKVMQPEKKQPEGQEEAAANTLAYALGIDPVALKQLLTDLNIKAEELLNIDKASEISGRLADLMGLTANEGQMLSMLVKSAAEAAGDMSMAAGQTDMGSAADSEAMMDRKEGGAEKSGLIQLDIKELEVVREQQTVDDFTSVLADLKLKIQELTRKYEHDPAAAVNEISKKLEEMLDSVRPADDSTTAGVKAEDPGAPGMKANDPAAKAASEEQSGNTENKDAGNEDSKEQMQEEGAFSAAPGVKSAEMAQVNGTAINHDRFAEGLAAVKAVQKEAPVQRSEIISQVVEKAKVVLSGDKSEMVMDLKPESLGKLSLKVITENGIVMAKFVAESQQVKQVLEANMQLLKDSLEKQGMEVQGFSVSVRQDSQDGTGRDKEADTRRSSGMHRMSASGGGTGTIAGTLQSTQQGRYYGWTDSSINLTA